MAPADAAAPATPTDHVQLLGQVDGAPPACPPSGSRLSLPARAPGTAQEFWRERAPTLRRDD